MFVNSPFNADGVASKTHFASVTSFRFHCGVRPKEEGTSFGREGERYVRIALVVEDAQIEEAGRRLKESGLFR